MPPSTSSIRWPAATSRHRATVWTVTSACSNGPPTPICCRESSCGRLPVARRASPQSQPRRSGVRKPSANHCSPIFSALAAGRAPPSAALALLREHWIKAAAAQSFKFADGRLAIAVDGADDDLDLVASIVAWRVVEHVLPAPEGRLRICQGTDCAWLFIDSSKAGRRRWCDMAVCGNSAKSRRFLARSRARA